MTTGRKTSKGEGKKLKIKKETLKNLEPKGGAVKGGMAAQTRSCNDGTCRTCPTACACTG